MNTKLKKIMISFAVIFHLLIVLSVPNLSSYFNYKFSSVVYTYVNILHVNFGWAFFSPDPSPAMFFAYEGFKNNDLVLQGEFPDIEPKNWFWPNHSRNSSMRNLFVRNSESVGKVLGKYLCTQHQDVDVIEFRKKIIPYVSYQDVNNGKHINDISNPVYEPSAKWECDRGASLDVEVF